MSRSGSDAPVPRRPGHAPIPPTFYLDRIEEAVVAALRAELRHPDVIAEFVRTYHEERRRLASQQGAKRTVAERRLTEVRREIEGIVDGVARGELASAVFGPRASALDEERKRLETSMAEEHESVVTLHPGGPCALRGNGWPVATVDGGRHRRRQH